MARRSAAQ